MRKLNILTALVLTAMLMVRVGATVIGKTGIDRPAAAARQHDGPSGNGEETPEVFFVLLDRSASTADQRMHWRRAVENALREVGFGDTVIVYSLDARTGDRAAVFHADIPTGGGLTRDTKARAARARMRIAALEAIDALLAKPPSPHTSVFDALELMPRPARCACRVRAWFFSDMLHDLPPLDLERTRVADTVAAARQVMTDMRLVSGSLAGADISVVLDDVIDESRVGVNPRAVLKTFYTELFERQLGARLVQFDPNERRINVAGVRR